MESVELKYGEGKVTINVEGAKSIEYLTENRMPEIEDLKAALLKAVNEDVIDSKPLKELIEADDKVTFVISDLTRFWPLEGYEPGKGQPSYDKQFVRDWLKANPDSDYLLPDDVIDKTVEKYKEAYKLLTGKDFSRR